MNTGPRIARRWFWLTFPLAAAFVFGGWTMDYLPDGTEVMAKQYRERRGKARSLAEAPRSGVRHTREFKTTGLHGSQFIRDKDSCKSCHGEDLRGGSSQKSCTQCHRALEYFDHFSDQASEPGAHGAAFFRAPENCAGCHGSDWKGKNAAFGCLDCHNFPHVGSWSLPTQHGAEYLKNGRSAAESDPANCLYCHADGSGFKERHPEKFINCAGCHPIIPHPDKIWVWGGHRVQARTYEGKCLHCHTDMKRLMPNMKNPDGCAKCHKGTKLEPIMKFLPKEPTAQFKPVEGRGERKPARSPAHWKSYQPFDQQQKGGSGK